VERLRDLLCAVYKTSVNTECVCWLHVIAQAVCLLIRNEDLYDDQPHSYYPRDVDDYLASSRPAHMSRYRDESPPPSTRREHRYSDSSYSVRRKETSPVGEVQFNLCTVTLSNLLCCSWFMLTDVKLLLGILFDKFCVSFIALTLFGVFSRFFQEQERAENHRKIVTYTQVHLEKGIKMKILMVVMILACRIICQCMRIYEKMFFYYAIEL